jgi:transcriptional regulator with XRE-family HTH domain
VRTDSSSWHHECELRRGIDANVIEIGQALRAARERQGLERAELERRTHIRSRYLGALEDERFDDIPGRAYAKGFLRVYGDALGLDGVRLVDEFNERYPEVNPVELEPLAPAPVFGARRRRGFAFAAIAAGAAAAIALVTALAWPSGGGHRRVGLSATPPAASAARAASHKPDRAVPKVTAVETAHLTLRASGPCWVSIRIGSATGATLYEGTLAAGGGLRYTLAPSRPRIWMRIGAPWAVTMALNGKQEGRLLTGPGNVLVTRAGLRTT